MVLASLIFISFGCGAINRSRTDTTSIRLNAENASTSLININTAATEELEKLPGIGKVIAERIIIHREKFGPFRRAAHLMMVQGISEKKFRELQPLITTD